MPFLLLNFLLLLAPASPPFIAISWVGVAGGSGVWSRTQDDYYDIFLSFCFLFFISFFFCFLCFFTSPLFNVRAVCVFCLLCKDSFFFFFCKILSENHSNARKFIITWAWRRRHWRQQRRRWWMVMTQPEAVAMLCYDMTLNDNNNNIIETFLRIKWIDTILLLT